MPTDRTLISLSDLVRQAALIVDPDGHDEAVAEFVARFEDEDEPVRSLLDDRPGHIEETVRFGADEHPPVVVAQAIVIYLAHRLDETTDDPVEIMRLALRAEFDGQPPEAVQRWLAEEGVEVE